MKNRWTSLFTARSIREFRFLMRPGTPTPTGGVSADLNLDATPEDIEAFLRATAGPIAKDIYAPADLLDRVKSAYRRYH